jgi:hypothetical protein
MLDGGNRRSPATTDASRSKIVAVDEPVVETALQGLSSPRPAVDLQVFETEAPSTLIASEGGDRGLAETSATVNRVPVIRDQRRRWAGSARGGV